MQEEPTSRDPITLRNSNINTIKQYTYLDILKNFFPSYQWIRPLGNQTGESYVYLIQDQTQYKVLKIYHAGIIKEKSISEKIQKLSRENPQLLCKIYKYGYIHTTNQYYEILEYHPNGNLKEFFTKNPNPELFKTVIQQINQALHLLHQNQIVHRDLKPSNVLIQKNNPLLICLIDFGISSLMKNTLKLTTLKGTPYYLAPESYANIITYKSDYWSFGLLIYGMILGKPLFQHISKEQMKYYLFAKEIPIPSSIPNEYQILLKGLLQKDPDYRWGYKEINQWLKGNLAKIQISRIPSKSYLFHNQYYNSPKKLAIAFLKSFFNFCLAIKHLEQGHIQNWLSHNFYGDDIIQILDRLENKKKEELVITFCYYILKDIPFSLYGFAITDSFIIQIIIKYLNKKRYSQEEEKIFELIKNKKIFPYYILYQELTQNKQKDDLYRLLEKLDSIQFPYSTFFARIIG